MTTTRAVLSTRVANMEKRRVRILASARETLSREGFEALTVRDLAKQAGVTVPTIYNLIGNKTAILRRLIEDMVLRCEDVLESSNAQDPLGMAESVVTSLAGLFVEDEDFCRAALLAGLHIAADDSDTTPSGLLERSAQIAMEICHEARAQGLLMGAIDTTTLGERAFDSYRIAVFDWLNGVIDTEGFQRNALIGFFVCLASDATPEFRDQLMSRIRGFEAENRRRRKRKPRTRTKKENKHAPK